jgi:hypothetical protein
MCHYSISYYCGPWMAISLLFIHNVHDCFQLSAPTSQQRKCYALPLMWYVVLHLIDNWKNCNTRWMDFIVRSLCFVMSIAGSC